MDYWRRRMLDAQKQVTDKGIDALNKQLRQYYKKVMQRTIDDFEAIYDKVLANAEEGKQITPADLYNLDKYYKIQAQLRDRLQQLGDKSCNAMSDAFQEEYKQIYTSLIDGHISDAAWSTIAIFGDGDTLPTITTMVAVLNASLQQLNHGLTLNDAYDIYDDYIADGHSASDFIKVIIDIYKVSGLIPANDEAEKN